ncbi:hypothetical protein PNEG_01445 [Pneumocystis murina B123]|uniref:RRM domain-containing protein n=1 Tax=Pneumocystis murina (strain B123) TaxID=1069680 RepID=M7NST0_PNEMU|nr:hypothetical protein PNEG_01445 [Pneumocystis murina B123]EMR10171.1 hypothetical protein PNEG_01445 [Pneumocystis murina B123]
MNEYTVLKIKMPKTSFKNTNLLHYLYIKEHDRYRPTPLANHPENFPEGPSLFVSNLPIDTTHDHLKYLFNHLGCRIQQVFFHFIQKPSYIKENISEDYTENEKNSEDTVLSVWKRRILSSGSWAIVEFLEKQDIQYILEKKNHKKLENYVWGQNIPKNRVPELGFNHYWDHYNLIYPSHEKLQTSIDKYMEAFYLAEEKKKRLRKFQRTEPDEEGFITVTRGGRTGAGRINEGMKMQEKKKDKYILHDFYKFQRQEGKNKKLIELKKKFEEDKEKIKEFREKKRFKMYS